MRILYLPCGDGARHTYDARDRRSGVVKGTASASYTYYPTGLRKTKLAGGANTTFVLLGVPTHFF